MAKVEIALPGQAGADALALPVAQPLGGDGAKIVDEKLGGRLARLGESGELRGERGEAVLLHVNGELEAPRVVAAGVGKREEVDADALRTAASATAQALSRVGGTLVWLLDESLPVPLPEQAAALVEGTILGSYSPGQWKSKNDIKGLERIVIGHADAPQLQTAVERAAIVAEQANRARDLSNMPPNELTPHTLGEKAKELAGEHEHLTCEVLATSELDHLGMGALTAVGRGSRNEPRLIVLRYDPPGARDDILLGLVGKPITFDAGGSRSGDLVWPFPLHPRFRRYIDSAFADMKNGSTLRQASPALAAEFLHEFAGDGPWCHVDMAGPAFLERSRGDYLRVPGGTGYGVRLIAELGRLVA